MLALGTAFLWVAVKVRELLSREPQPAAELHAAQQAVESLRPPDHVAARTRLSVSVRSWRTRPRSLALM